MKKLLAILMMLPILAFGKTITLSSSNTINFNQDFNAMFVAKKQIEAITKCAANIGSTINVVLYSPGGSISAGQLFFDTLNSLPCKFDTITVFGASMSYQTTQNLGRRYIISSGTLMSHRASLGGLSGELGGELNQVIRYYTQMVKEMEIIAANRVGITLEKYQEAIRDELWLTAKEAVKLNHADEIVDVVCDKSLMGTHVEVIRTFFGSFDVEFSNCPIVVAPLNASPSNNTEVREGYDFNNYFNNINRRITLKL